jgi:tetratricopeptide (TPR) repeat protein
VAFLSYIRPARDLFFKERDVAGAEAMLSPQMGVPTLLEEKRAVHELMGLILRAQGRFEEALQVYEPLEDHYQAGYCALLLGDMPRMQQHWTHILTVHPNHWCLSLYGMVMHQLRSYPSLFQIRNHLESDIANLIVAERLDYLDNLLAHIEFLTQLNLETPKFAGRALMHAGLLEKAGPFLLQGQKALPNDPEIYFHLGQFSVALQHYREARLMLKQCLMISPAYRPARELLTQIPEVAAS